jgi:hypothetical protein
LKSVKRSVAAEHAFKGSRPSGEVLEGCGFATVTHDFHFSIHVENRLPEPAIELTPYKETINVK